MTQSYRLQHLFQKYLANQCSPAEVEELMGQLNEADDDELEAPMQALWQKSREQAAGPAIDWDRMFKEVTGSEESLTAVRRNRRHNFRRLWLHAAAAASILVILSVGINYYIYKNNGKARLAYTEKTVPVKRTEVVLLEDGSKITLNAGSSLRYPQSFNGPTREVYLDGEGLFEVAHDAHKPFIVHSGQLKTQVLGTTFNISAYPGAEKMEVTVISGKVTVEETVSKRTALLLPNQRVVFNTNNNRFTTNALPTIEPTLAWQQGRIGFDDASLSEVAAQFYRRYGIRVILENPRLAECRISIVLNNDSVDNLLKTITSLTNSNYKYHGKEVVLYGEGCN